MAVDGVAGRVYYAAAIPGLTDIAASPGPAASSGTKQFPDLTPAQSAANAAAAGATTTSTNSDNPLTNAAGGALDKNAFLKLLVQEMTNQDPLKPADNTEFIAQLAQFSTLEQMQNLNTGFQNMQSAFQTAQARGLLGTTVHAVNSNTGASVDGTVDQVLINANGTVQVDVNGTPVNLSDIQSVTIPGLTSGSSGNGGDSSSSLPGTLVPPASGSAGSAGSSGGGASN